jgi:23S rRNA pseudouridine2604 synthase
LTPTPDKPAKREAPTPKRRTQPTPPAVAPSAAAGAPVAGTRLNKWLAEHGLCSRREADAVIRDGRVKINGAIAQMGQRVSATDRVELDAQVVSQAPRAIYIAFHKPVGVECTTDTRVAHNIIDFIAHPERIFPIGRLDKNSEGLILLTNDGDIVNPLLRVENAHEKEYVVDVDKPVTDEFVTAMGQGVTILDRQTLPCSVWRTGKNQFHIVLKQGLNRQIRRMCEVFGMTVRRLVRVRFVNIRLSDIPVGRWRHLSQVELNSLLPGYFSPPR